MKAFVLVAAVSIQLILIVFYFVSVSAYGEDNQQELYAKKIFTKYEVCFDQDSQVESLLQDSLVYVVVENVTTGNKTKGIFFPIVDEFSQLNVLGSK